MNSAVMSSIQTQSHSDRSLIKFTPVVNTSFLDIDLVNRCIENSYMSENGIDQEYVEWNTDWIFSSSARELSNYLVLKGIPKGMTCLLKIEINEG